MKKINLLAGILLTGQILLHSSCGNEVADTDPNPPVKDSSVVVDTLSYVPEHIEKRAGECNKREGSCFTMIFDKIVFDTKSNPVANVINAWIETRMISAGDASSKSIQEMCDKMEKNYLAELEADPENTMSWSIEAKSEIDFQNKDFISLSVSVYQFMGGAHPNSHVEYASFRKSDGQRLNLGDIVNDTVALNKTGEICFRKDNGIEADADFFDLGFEFGDEGFVLNSNFILGKTGLEFFFNTYEIGPYAMGSFTCEIPYATIENILKDEFKTLI